MTWEDKQKKAKEIVESLRKSDYHYHMARFKIEYDTSIFGSEKEEIFELVKNIMK